ncbi:MAG: TrmH family RNA methyltransferase [Nitriliruptor sp.]
MQAAYGEGGGPDPSLRQDVARLVTDARRDPTRVLLEGVHALKHAARFGATFDLVVTPALARLTTLLAELAPDVPVPDGTLELSRELWRELVPHELPSPALAVARRPRYDVGDVLAAPGRVVVLDRPRHLGNLGAVVRVAAAADAGGVLVLGGADPWHPTAVRAAAGLHFALPVANAADLPDPGATQPRPVVALHPDGDGATSTLPTDALLLVGTERGGLSDALLARADRRLRLPMREGVSSLNLATAVAAALYGAAPPPG